MSIMSDKVWNGRFLLSLFSSSIETYAQKNWAELTSVEERTHKQRPFTILLLRVHLLFTALFSHLINSNRLNYNLVTQTHFIILL